MRGEHDLLEGVLLDGEGAEGVGVVDPANPRFGAPFAVNVRTEDADPAVGGFGAVVAAEEVLLLDMVHVDERLVVQHQLRGRDAARGVGLVPTPGRALLVPDLDDLDVRLGGGDASAALGHEVAHREFHGGDVLEAEEQEGGALVLAPRRHQADRAGEVAVHGEKVGRAADAGERVHCADGEGGGLPIGVALHLLDFGEILLSRSRGDWVRRVGQYAGRKTSHDGEKQSFHVVHPSWASTPSVQLVGNPGDVRQN